MINQDRVREMTRMSILESGAGEKELKISTFRKFDYVLLQMLKGFFAGTICFAAFFVLWIFWKWDDLNYYFADANFEGFIIRVLVRYAIFLGCYLVLSAVAALGKYKTSRMRRETYMRHLHHLDIDYKQERDS